MSSKGTRNDAKLLNCLLASGHDIGTWQYQYYRVQQYAYYALRKLIKHFGFRPKFVRKQGLDM